MHDYWNRTDPQVMQYVHQREEEALRGIGQYKSVADRWGNTLKPYDQYFRQYNIDPHQAVGNLVAAHMILKYGTQQQKIAALQVLDKDYGLRQYFGQQGVAQPQGPDLSPIQNRLAQMEARMEQGALSEAQTAVERFIADPANDLAAEALPKMLELVESGRAANLKDAYEIATRTDPVLFERIIARRVEAATRGGARPSTNLRPSGVPARTAGRARGSIDDTMRETLSNIQSR